MKNFIQPGTMITVIAPYAVTSGQGVKVGTLFGIAAYNAAQGAQVEIKREGVFDLTAVTADTAAPGAKVYWDDAARKITTTATNNTLVGAVTVDKSGSVSAATVLLDGVVR
jgi:predicted RecA/RadA family phage recombinase